MLRAISSQVAVVSGNSISDLQTLLAHMLAVRKADFAKLFDRVTHDLSCAGVPAASIWLHFVRHDATGEPQFDRIIETLLKYITLYCFKSARRTSYDEIDQNERYRRARKLFRDTPTSGQVGELMIYFLIEAVLDAPQILKKMPLTTNPSDERKGSDGVHMRWVEAEQILEVIYGESKFWQTFSGALADAFKSMETFHNSEVKKHEIEYYTGEFSVLEEPLKSTVLAYLEGEKISQTRQVHACLVGYDWNEYKCLNDDRRAAFVAEFEQRYLKWAKDHMQPLLESRLSTFTQKHLRLEFFFLPFSDVEAFRKKFNDEL